jgi:Zn-dependent protease with chaperone function
MTKDTAWLARRALLAIALMAGFYLFALAIVFGLLWIPYAEVTYVGRVHLKLTLVCIGAALTLLWALVPRVDRFEPPGPRLDEASHPELFALVRDVARATEQEPPSDVYLVNEVNAFVTHRGGFMGFGSRRVMGIGLPLLQTLSTVEFKAVLAHEFGHYASGDVKLGPWIYKTHGAIARALQGTQETLLEAPFNWYAMHFLRLTNAVSRQQEFIADKVAARVAGADALAGALRRLNALSLSFGAYVQNEVRPVVDAGYVPPLAAGYKEFISRANVAAFFQHVADDLEAGREPDLFDTHPLLRDRLAALAVRTAAAGGLIASSPALRLLRDPEAHARALTPFTFGGKGDLKGIDWSEVGDRVYAPQWRAMAKRHAKWLERYTPAAIPLDRAAWIAAGTELLGRRDIDEEERVRQAAHVFGVGVAVAMLDAGWRAHTGPGLPVVLVRGGEEFNPFAAVESVAEGRLSVEEWKGQAVLAGSGAAARTAATA